MRTSALLIAPALCVLAASTAFAAGDVSAALSTKGVLTLTLTGDDLANDVQIDRDLATKEFVVLGRNGTTINGAAEFRTLGVRTIRAAMNGGDDVLAVGGLNLTKGFYADLGDGNDTLSLYHTVVRGKLIVHGGAGDDTIKVEAGSDLRAGGLLDAGEGANHVAITDSYVRGPLRILAGSGADLVEVHRAGFTQSASLSVRTGAGDDVVDYLGNTFQCPVGTLTEFGVDTINVKTSRFVKAVGMNGGDGDDVVNVERCTFDARFFISGGKGTNKASVVGAGFSSGGLVIAGGKGHSGHFYWAFLIVNVY